MPFSYEELGGSPKIKGDRKRTTATREFKVGDESLPEFLANATPSPSSGYGDLATVKGFPWCACVGFEIEPFTEKVEPDDGSGPAGCDWWKVVLHYDSSNENQQQGPREGGVGGDGQNPGDGSGPGGDEGSTSGEDVQFVSHEISVGGEFLTIPDHGCRWEEAVNGSDQAAGVKAGIIVPLIDHDVELANCSTPPWGALRSLVGHVNVSGYAGAATGSVLYLGCRARRGRSRDGSPVWSLGLKLSERGQGLSWNQFYRPETGRFERLLRKDGRPLYPATDFKTLFSNLGQKP